MNTNDKGEAIAQECAWLLLYLTSTLVWGVAVAVSLYADWLPWYTIVLLFVLLVALTAIHMSPLPASLKRAAGYCLPLYGGYLLYARHTSRLLGNEFVRKSGLVGKTDERDYRVYLTRPTRWTDGLLEIVNLPVRGLNEEKLKAVLHESLALCNAEDFELYRPTPVSHPHRWNATLYYLNRLDSLEPRVLNSIPPVKACKGSFAVRVGQTVQGDRWIDFSGISGVIAAGIPGSGKTAAADLVIAALLSRPDLSRVFVADGKGGADWFWCKPFVERYTNDDGFDGVLDMMHAAYDLMQYRLSTNYEQHGDSNFWHWGPDADSKMLCVVLDEVQTWTSPIGHDKETKAKAEEFIGLLQGLVKKGRSAGIVVIMLTQKPTTDALPSGIRDNAACRIAFRCTTPEMVKAALGDIPEGDPTPLDLPFSRKGLSVMTKPDGGTEFTQWDYIPETEIPVLLDTTRSGVPARP